MQDADLLLRPLSLRGITLKNRIVMAPMAVNHAEPDGRVSERSVAYYATRAAGGVALVIVEASFVSPEGRAFACGVGSEVPGGIGNSVPLIVRLSGEDYVPDGLTIADTSAIAKRLVGAGVDVVDVFAGAGADSPSIGSTALKRHSAKTPRGFFRPLAAAIKRAVDPAPVTAVCILYDPVLAAEVLASGDADLIGLGRALLVDPDWPNKVAAGRSADIHCCTCSPQKPAVCKCSPLLGLEFIVRNSNDWAAQ